MDIMTYENKRAKLSWVKNCMFSVAFLLVSGCAQSGNKMTAADISEVRQKLQPSIAADPKLARFEERVRLAFAEPDAQAPISKQGLEKKNTDRPMNWQTRFTFEGQVRPGPYSVDPHIWVYTKEFAERFGMPLEWADPELKGAEAAAWRKTKTGYVTCGWGGKKDACREEEGEVLELYFDTAETKLPWAPWSEEFQHLGDRLWSTSTRFLTTQRCESRREPSPTPLVGRSDRHRDCIENTYRTPFADSKTGSEIHLYAKGRSYNGQGNGRSIAAYDKRAYPNVAWVQLGYSRVVGLFEPPEAAILTLETRDSPLGKTLQVYHTIVLPQSFDRSIKALDSRRGVERDFYKKSLDMK